MNKKVKIIPLFIMIFVYNISLSGCKGCKKEEYSQKFEKKDLIVTVPRKGKGGCLCMEFYRHPLTTDEQADKLLRFNIGVHKLNPKDYEKTKIECPKENVLLLAKAYHDGKERGFMDGITVSIGPFDVIYYYYKGGTTFKTDEDAIRHAKRYLTQKQGFTLEIDSKK